MPRKKIPAVQYLRASTELQQCSAAQQRVAIADYARQRGYKIMGDYVDDGLSGLTLTDRPAMQRLLADALAPSRTFEAILVYDVSRWGRFQDADQGGHYEFLCRQAGVQILYCCDTFENDGSAIADMLKQMQRAIAGDYSRALSDRIRLAMRYMAGEGYWTCGPAPFGFERDIVDTKGRIVGRLAKGERKLTRDGRTRLSPGPPEAVETIRCIFEWFVHERFTTREITLRLNEEGRPSRRPGGWSTPEVWEVLHRHEYVGDRIFGRRKNRLGQTSIAMEPEDWLLIEGACPAIVPRELFDAAQVRLARARSTEPEKRTAVHRIRERRNRSVSTS